MAKRLSCLTDNFAVSIASPVAAKEQQSKEAETTANTFLKVVIKSCDYYASHKTTCGAHMQPRCMFVKNRARSYISPMKKLPKTTCTKVDTTLKWFHCKKFLASVYTLLKLEVFSKDKLNALL